MLNYRQTLAMVFLSGVISLQSAVAKVTVFAAASMTNALQQIATEYQKQYPNQEIEFSFASSSVLAKQIEKGAPADIFLSADLKWLNYLQEKQAIEPNSQFIVARNALVMIAPKDSPINHIDLSRKQWQRFLDTRYLAVGDPDHVPAGIYAKQALTALGQWKAVETKLARANNVRAALALVEQGESPLGIVYRTDGEISQKVKIVATFPSNSHQAVEYPVAIVKDHQRAEVVAFYQYLASPQAKNRFQQYGFIAN